MIGPTNSEQAFLAVYG